MFLRLLGLARLDDLESMRQRHNTALQAVERLSGLQLTDNRTIARLSEDNAQLQRRVAELITALELMAREVDLKGRTS